MIISWEWPTEDASSLMENYVVLHVLHRNVLYSVMCSLFFSPGGLSGQMIFFLARFMTGLTPTGQFRRGC